MLTDAKRLQQIIKNLLSNAFKFTHTGQVTLRSSRSSGGWTAENEDLNRADEVLAFSVVGYRHRHLAAISSRSFSKRSNRPTAAPAASTAGPAWAWRSAASSRACCRARYDWRAARRGVAHLPCMFRARIPHALRETDAVGYIRHRKQRHREGKVTSGRAAEHLDAGGQSTCDFAQPTGGAGSARQ